MNYIVLYLGVGGVLVVLAIAYWLADAPDERGYKGR